MNGNLDFQFVQLLVQYATLQEKIGPLVGPASQKLVRDLVDTGCSVKKLAQVAGRSPSYIQGVYKGNKQLGAQELCAVIRHAMRSGDQNAGK